MNGLSLWGGFIVVICLGTMAWSLWNACTPAHWPMPRMYRWEHPVYYWLAIVGYAGGAALGVALAFN